MEPILLEGLRVTVACLAAISVGSALLWADEGLSHFDGEIWTTHSTADEEPGKCLITVRQGESELITTNKAIAHNFVLAIARRDQEIWVGTGKGLSLGLPQPWSADQGTEHGHQGGKPE